MMMRKRVCKQRSGVAAVELALLLAFLLTPLLLGVLEVGRLIETQQILSNGAREGARQAATGQLTNDEVAAVVRSYLQNAGLDLADISIQVVDETTPGDVSNANQLDLLRVTVTLPFRNVRWVALDYFTSYDTTLTAQAYWYSLKDKDYPSPNDPPIE